MWLRQGLDSNIFQTFVLKAARFASIFQNFIENAKIKALFRLCFDIVDITYWSTRGHPKSWQSLEDVNDPLVLCCYPVWELCSTSSSVFEMVVSNSDASHAGWSAGGGAVQSPTLLQDLTQDFPTITGWRRTYRSGEGKMWAGNLLPQVPKFSCIFSPSGIFRRINLWKNEDCAQGGIYLTPFIIPVLAYTPRPQFPCSKDSTSLNHNKRMTEFTIKNKMIMIKNKWLPIKSKGDNQWRIKDN
jgi:hypothetical protein